MRISLKILALGLIACLSIGLSACSRDYGYSRTAFNSKFLDKSVEAGIEAAGQPDTTEKPDANTTVLIYKRPTFDQENGNAKDAQVKATFKADAKGKQMFSGIEFIPEQ